MQTSSPRRENILTKEKIWKINTSNWNKLKEFREIFAKYGVELESTSVDLMEIEADPITVVVHKASHAGERVLVDDSILDIEGAKIGINVRWMLERLPQFEGRKALWTVHLAYREKGKVLIFEGHVRGTIVKARGESDFGFNPVFQPEGSDKTLAEAKPDSVNARAMAVAALMEGRVKFTKPAMDDWNGRWQEK